MHASDVSQTTTLPHPPPGRARAQAADASPEGPSRSSRVRGTIKRVLESNAYGRRLRAFYWRLREDLDVNDSLASPGFQALMVYRFGAWHLTLPRPARRLCAIIYWPLFVFTRNVYGIEIPATATIGRRLRISHQHGIVLHPHLVVGDDCVIRQNVTIGGALGHHHGAILGNRVDVAAGAVILGRVRIGDDARIGPNAVVTMHVPPGATAFTSPARVITVPRSRSRQDASAEQE